MTPAEATERLPGKVSTVWICLWLFNIWLAVGSIAFNVNRIATALEHMVPK